MMTIIFYQLPLYDNLLRREAAGLERSLHSPCPANSAQQSPK